jgi:hypothetical protein
MTPDKALELAESLLHSQRRQASRVGSSTTDYIEALEVIGELRRAPVTTGEQAYMDRHLSATVIVTRAALRELIIDLEVGLHWRTVLEEARLLSQHLSEITEELTKNA